MPEFIKHFQTNLHQQRDRWVLWIPVGLAIGVGGYFSLQAEPLLWTGIVALGFMAALLAPFYRNKAVVLLWLPFFLVSLGFTAAQWRTWSVAAPVLEYKTYTLVLRGRVAELDELPQGFRFVLDRVQYESGKRLSQNHMPSAVRITSKMNVPPPIVGDVVQVKAVLLPLSPPVAPGAYDFQRKAFFDGLGATGYAVSKVETIVHQDNSNFFFAALRHYIRTHIEAQIADKDSAAMTAGILIGESKAISAEAWDNIRLAGLAHLLSIAGLHTGAVTGWLFFLVRYLLASIPFVALRYPVKKISAAVSIIGAIFYLCLVNFFLPAERAVIMVCVVMMAIIMDRDPFSLRLLAFAATVILLLRPESLVGISFQMSFAAVSVLIAFYEGTRNWWERLYQDKRWFMKLALFVLGSMATTGAATLGTAPYSLFHFLRVPIVSGFIANLIAVPIVIVVTLPLGIISCFLMPFGLEAAPLKMVGISVAVILKIAETVAHWPYAAYHANSWPLSLLLLITCGGLWVCIWRGRLRWCGLLPIIAGVALIPLTPRADILLSESGKVFAVRGANDMLLLSPGRADNFTRQSWIEREGEHGYDDWPEENGPQKNTPISCGAEACIYKAKGHLVSFIRNYSALARDCAAADIVISNLYILREQCPKPPLLLDRKSMLQDGAQALYFKEDGSVFVSTAHAQRGHRPWTGGLLSKGSYSKVRGAGAGFRCGSLSASLAMSSPPTREVAILAATPTKILARSFFGALSGAIGCPLIVSSIDFARLPSP